MGKRTRLNPAHPLLEPRVSLSPKSSLARLMAISLPESGETSPELLTLSVQL